MLSKSKGKKYFKRQLFGQGNLDLVLCGSPETSAEVAGRVAKVWGHVGDGAVGQVSARVGARQGGGKASVEGGRGPLRNAGVPT